MLHINLHILYIIHIKQVQEFKNYQNTSSTSKVTNRKGSQSDTFKAACCCCDVNMHLTLHLLLFEQSM